jgi:hypothetical protein
MTAKELFKNHIIDYIKQNFDKLKENYPIDNYLIPNIEKDIQHDLEWTVEEIYLRQDEIINKIIDISDNNRVKYIFKINDKMICYSDIYGMKHDLDIYFVELKEKIVYEYQKVE